MKYFFLKLCSFCSLCFELIVISNELAEYFRSDEGLTLESSPFYGGNLTLIKLFDLRLPLPHRYGIAVSFLLSLTYRFCLFCAGNTICTFTFLLFPHFRGALRI